MPGFLNRRGVTGTEKVRIKSLVERTRLCVVETMSKGEFEEDDGEESVVDTTDDEMDGDLIMDEDIDVDEPIDSDDWDMQVAKVYDMTLVELGDSMEGPIIGIRPEP